MKTLSSFVNVHNLDTLDDPSGCDAGPGAEILKLFEHDISMTWFAYAMA